MPLSICHKSVFSVPDSDRMNNDDVSKAQVAPRSCHAMGRADKEGLTCLQARRSVAENNHEDESLLSFCCSRNYRDCLGIYCYRTNCWSKGTVHFLAGIGMHVMTECFFSQLACLSVHLKSTAQWVLPEALEISQTANSLSASASSMVSFTSTIQ